MTKLEENKLFDINEEEWQKLKNTVLEYRSLYALYLTSPFEMFALLHIDELLERYNKGERTQELFELMQEVH